MSQFVSSKILNLLGGHLREMSLACQVLQLSAQILTLVLPLLNLVLNLLDFLVMSGQLLL